MLPSNEVFGLFWHNPQSLVDLPSFEHNPSTPRSVARPASPVPADQERLLPLAEHPPAAAPEVLGDHPHRGPLIGRLNAQPMDRTKLGSHGH